jgi:hypothetical protein
LHLGCRELADHAFVVAYGIAVERRRHHPSHPHVTLAVEREQGVRCRMAEYPVVRLARPREVTVGREQLLDLLGVPNDDVLPEAGQPECAR